MLIYPRYPFPNYYYKKNNNYNNLNKQTNTNTNTNSKQNNKEKNRITKNSNTINTLISLGPLNFNINGLTNNEEPIFEMFGIQLYLDDIIILCILFFLYKEKVDDNLLYLSLILILLS